MHLDPRQRAMLRQMGVRVWQPATPVADMPVASESIAAQADPISAKGESGHESRAAQAVAAAPRPGESAAPLPRQGAAPGRIASPPPVPAAPQATPVASASGAPAGWHLGQAQTLFADTAQAGGARWLVLAQTPPAALNEAAIDGDAGRLLANMLRAARLHQDAGAVVFAPLVRQAIAGPMDGFFEALSTLVGQTRPDMVLVMGRLAGQALLASSEPFGKLRGRPHVLEGRTTVVTHDAPYLLRCPQDKARAWDDLCLATGLATGLVGGHA